MPYIIRGAHTTNPKNLHLVRARYERSEYFEVDYTFDVSAFAKMLAKIAHCLSCANLHKLGKLSDDVFVPYLPPFIRGLNDNLGPYLVGQMQHLAEPEVDSDYYKYMIFTMTHEGKRFQAATIRLFSNWRGHSYTVVVGERLD